MDYAEMSPALVWDCEECGRENFQRCIIKDADPEEREGICDDLGLDPESEHVSVRVAHEPRTVTCRYCDTTYLAKNSWSLEAGEDEGY